MANINEKFIVNLKGKDFVTYEGLLDLAHQGELQEIKTELIQLPAKENGNQCIVKAVVIGPNKHFEGYGDADPTNVNSMITRHIIRMAETRAKARALRDYTNVGMTAIEELGGDEGDKLTSSPSQGSKPPSGVNAGYKCAECNAEINQAVKAYSEKYFGKPLCRECQQKAKK